MSQSRWSFHTASKGTVSLYSVDAATAQTSGAVYHDHNDPRSDVGAWITISEPQLTPDPGQSQTVSFQVSIPSTVRPGQHLGGIVAEDVTQQSTAQSQNNSTFQVHVKNLRIVAVQVDLPGKPIEQLGIQVGGDNGYQRLLVGLSNTGNQMLNPNGNLQVTDTQGHVVTTPHG